MPMPPFQSEQSAGLSTAESDSMSGSKHDRNPSCADPATAKHGASSNASRPVALDKVSPAPAPPPPSPKAKVSKRIIFSKNHPKRITSERNDISLDQSIGGSAPTILIHTPSTSSDDPSVAPLTRPIRSAMSSRTLHESLHKGKLQAANRPKMNRSISWANVNIREYERVMGDNPSVTSGPPLSLGWRYTPEPITMKLDDFEEGKGLPRSSSEFLVPKSVRESLLREHADVSRNEMVKTIRAIQKEKMHRRKTVVNLSMQPTEEKIEGAKRKLKKILKPSLSYESLEAKMWDEAHAIAMEKARRLEESIRKGESVSSRDLYSVGTPCNNILPSRRNSVPRNMAQNPEQDKEDGAQLKKDGDSDNTSATSAANDLSLESLSKSLPQYNPKPTGPSHVVQQKRSSAGELDSEHHQHHVKVFTDGPHSRASSGIVAEEDEDDDIFASLVLDDVITN